MLVAYTIYVMGLLGCAFDAVARTCNEHVYSSYLPACSGYVGLVASVEA